MDITETDITETDTPEQGLPAAPATPVGANRPASVAASTPPVPPSATPSAKRRKKDAQEVCVDTEIMKYLNTKNTQEDAEDDEDTIIMFTECSYKLWR